MRGFHGHRYRYQKYAGLYRPDTIGSDGKAPARPASTRMLITTRPDAVLDLTGTSINAFHEQVEKLVDFTNEFGGTKWTRELLAFGTHPVARTGGNFIDYASPNTADGLLNKWIDSDGSHNAAQGCAVLVFKPTSVDDGAGWFSTRVNANMEGGMLNDGADTDKFRFRIRDTGGGMVGPAVACALNQWHFAIGRWNSTHVFLSIDGGPESSIVQSPPGGCSNMNNRMEILGDSGGGSRARGDFEELSIIDPADMGDMVDFLRAEYPALA